MSGWDAAFARLRPLTTWPSIRQHKLQEFYTLAARVSTGCIVELGTFRGVGTIALALGAADGHAAPVFTIDDRVTRHGWAGETYTDEDAQIFQQNITAASVRISAIVGESSAVARTWQQPVGLVVWDLGIRDRLLQDFVAWHRLITPDGLFVVKDIGPPGFGREAIERDSEWTLERACERGLVYSYGRRLGRH